MIEFEKINEKGDILKAYTHKNYLSKHYNQQICRVQKRNQTISGLILYGTTIFSYWALNNVVSLNKIIQTKISWKGRYLIVSFLTGLASSFVASAFLANSVNNSHDSMLKKEIFPAWFHKERVINPNRVFFELDDNTHNEPNIWHSGLNLQAIERLLPDFYMGNPYKPHPPVAQIHH